VEHTLPPDNADSASEPEIQSKLAAIKEKTPLVVLKPPAARVEPQEPSAPSKEMFPNTSLFTSLPDIRVSLPQPRNPNLPRIRKTNSYELTYECEKLKHGFIWNLMPLYVVFDAAESAKSFSIHYTTHAGNMIDEETETWGRDREGVSFGLLSQLPNCYESRGREHFAVAVHYPLIV
jgi:hypothetical protein